MSPKGTIRLLRRTLKHSHEGFSIFFNALSYTNALSEIMFEKLVIHGKLVLCSLMINGPKMGVDNVCRIIFTSVCK